MQPAQAMAPPAPILTLASALILAAPAAAQVPVPISSSPIEAAVPSLPDWSPRLSFHAAGGVLAHALDTSARRTAVLRAGAAYNPEPWVHLEAEVATARLAELRQCPAEGAGCPSDVDGARFVTLFTGVRVAAPIRPVSGYVAARSGLELAGPHRVFEAAAGATLHVLPRVALRVELSHRWDYKFVVGSPPGGTAVTLGLMASGGD